ncbi:MAG: amidophosphoribosyltransferase [Candidatus Tectomicrobia bacterium]|uniref:Amidophosphoribosyltransferase n=1 Tax=Tectimicrobiota bacterium TaxID=2528274 RepID=A0A937W082_UNCTE|nr:amidophosphoribosyltransferase [Candidatus Tectomicrobia bacterium]
MHEDKFHDECAVVGVYGHPEAAKLTYLGLYALQHRGQESTGIVASEGQAIHTEVGMGRVNDFFTQERLTRLPGHLAIGHNRYSTTGSSVLRNAQPLLVDYARGSLAIAHNGNLVNAQRLRAELEAHGSLFRSTTDTEVILHLVAQSHTEHVLDGILEALQQVEGAYSLVMMNRTDLIAARDPHGFRPLCLGQLGDGYVIASETCALDLIEATYLRDVAPGEIIRISPAGLQSYFPFPPTSASQCIFELIYFARPDSDIFGQNVHLIRKAFGRQLAREAPVEADVVIPVPDSGVAAALGYAEEAGIPFDVGLIRNHYVGRTFIEPQQSIRHFGVKIKLNAIRSFLEGKRVVIVDDSIVRGTTSQKLVHMVRHAGAKEVHMRISSPPTTHPCIYGIDTPTREELIAARHTVEEIRDYLQADSLAYLSHAGMMRVAHGQTLSYCSACFTGAYPIQGPWQDTLLQLSLFEKQRL